mgnify:CR=1 FL=1
MDQIQLGRQNVWNGITTEKEELIQELTRLILELTHHKELSKVKIGKE